MTARERQICEAINRYGSGQHPFADAETLPFFKKDYVDECLRAKYNDEHREPQAYGDDGEDYGPLPRK